MTPSIYTSPDYVKAYAQAEKAATNKDNLKNPHPKGSQSFHAWEDAQYDVWSRRTIGVYNASVFREVTHGKTVANAFAE